MGFHAYQLVPSRITDQCRSSMLASQVARSSHPPVVIAALRDHSYLCCCNGSNIKGSSPWKQGILFVSCLYPEANLLPQAGLDCSTRNVACLALVLKQTWASSKTTPTKRGSSEDAPSSQGIVPSSGHILSQPSLPEVVVVGTPWVFGPHKRLGKSVSQKKIE